jgi:hypothetical protein
VRDNRRFQLLDLGCRWHILGEETEHLG